MMNLNAAVGRPPLVLVVDPVVASRHAMWRALSGAFGVLEASSAAAARTWIARRPDIDAIVIQDDLPDERGRDLVRELGAARRPIAAHAIVLARRTASWGALVDAGLTLVERGNLRGVLSHLASWLSARDAHLARSLLRSLPDIGQLNA